jgi:general secretion pathway protein J
MMAGQRGFTLMEMLIAIAITAVIGLGVWQVLNGVITARDRVNEVAGEFAALQRTMLLFERDMNQIINRPARDFFGDVQPALTSLSEPFNLLFTRQGWRNPLGQRRSDLQPPRHPAVRAGENPCRGRLGVLAHHSTGAILLASHSWSHTAA